LKILIYYKIKIKCDGAELLPYLHVIKLKHMKIVNGIISVLLGILALYLMIIAKSNLDLTYMFIILMMSIVFMCFMIIEEQKDEVDRLRREMWGRIK
jgi:high-affinity Fe2+/Pb2+ permease